MEKVLVNSDKYAGQYIAMVSAEDNTIVCSGILPEEALNEARKQNVQAPILFYVPEKEVVYIYYVG